MKRTVWTMVLALIIGLTLSSSALAQSGSNFSLSWWTIDGGGATFLQGINFTLGCTIGQPDASKPISGGNFTLYAGFWFPSCVPSNGDVDGSGCVEDADLLEVLFNFGATGQRRADVNCDGIVDDADLLDVLFNFGNGCR